LRKITPIRFDRIVVNVSGELDFISSLPKTERTTTRASEKAYGRWLPLGFVSIQRIKHDIWAISNQPATPKRPIQLAQPGHTMRLDRA
jgi:hypothetical protein